ncbi:MAG: hypothetical protein IPJ38_03440 [Dechloromonas sp.]|uniref:Phosphoglycerate mutase n=1 Tax=Candidatus Dechloromonas phosphorivorans TaxID=2899244 RepID=A0A935MV16_9RHOO|nr:hypothetical protein [Candidatus Dechloromonas phosphorivorans]
MHLTLLVPELIWPEPSSDQFTLGKLAAPGFEWLIARAQLDRQPRLPFETSLGKLFGLEAPPFGALRLLSEGHAPANEGHWLCADPVHLRFHQERIILADAGAFELDDGEAQSITAALNKEFADIGQFHVASAKRWYLRLNVAVDHPVEPISSVAGRRVDGELSGGALPLTRWLNEVQMFLHGHPVNEKRESEGKPVINSLWLWGGGKLDEAQYAAGHSVIFSDNPLAIGIASAAGIPLHIKPANLAALLDQVEAGENPLVVFDQLLFDILYENSEGWRDDFAALENNWFLPLKCARKQVDRIPLLAPTVYGELRYTINAGERWKFWKKGSSVQAIAQALAGNESK